MQIVSFGYNFLEMLEHIFWEKKKRNINLSLKAFLYIKKSIMQVSWNSIITKNVTV